MGQFAECGKDRGNCFDNLHKMSVWEYYEKDEDGIKNFNKAMNGVTQMVVPHILAAYDFTPFKTIVDIGGGDGALLCAIIKSTTDSKGIVLDLAHAKQQALANIQNNHLQDRCSFEEGSFFEAVPADASLYLMKSVLHDWNDEESKKILANVCQVMPQGSKLLMIEYVIPERNVPHPSKFMDMNMLVMTGGRGRTAKEWQQLIEEAGLKFSKIIATQSPMFPIIETKKA
jgi:cyclopropane fatty-acyl-phospholipid synthase-like methyltransferase